MYLFELFLIALSVSFIGIPFCLVDGALSQEDEGEYRKDNMVSTLYRKLTLFGLFLTLNIVICPNYSC